MATLTTNYLGIKLKNPLIVGACNLSLDLDKARKMEDAGAAAIVFKSLFEEQINLESLELEDELTEYAERNAEMINLFPSIQHAGPEEHLDKLSKTKQALEIPVIGSLNCVHPDTWVDYAVEMEKTGIDALELNMYAYPDNFEKSSAQIEEEQLGILKSIKEKISIPISIKLSPHYANILHHVKQMDEVGVNGFVLFNKLIQPDIDVKSVEHEIPWSLSKPSEHRISLRFVGLLYQKIQADLCGNRGVYSGGEMAKLILAGASAVQVVSAIYQHKESQITTILNELTAWMEEKGFASLNDFRGKLSNAEVKDPFVYKRAQYVDIMMKPFELLRKYPMI